MFKSGITILSVLLLVSFNAYSQEKNVVIENCHVDGVKAQVKCGKLSVPENYNKIDGEQISINFVV